MKIGEIFKDSLTYPSNDWNKLLILGVLVIVANLATFLPALGISLHSIGLTGIILTIVSIISLIINLFIAGYSFNIIRETISNINTLPEFKAGENIVDGIKVLIISIIYYLIPFIITLIVALITGAFDNLLRVGLGANMTNALAMDLAISFFVVFLVAVILFILFTLIATIAIARFAEKGNMGAAFEFSAIFDTVSKIGWGNYIVWYVVLIIILMIISFVMLLINIIPIVGVIITLLFFYPYMTLISARATGLIYNEKNA